MTELPPQKIIQVADLSDTREDNPNGQHREIPISGRFGRFQSSYWAGLLGAFGLRYGPRESFRPGFNANPGDPGYSYAKKHAYSAIAGGIMEGVTAYYGVKTWSDIKSIFAEAVAWEKGKDEKNVNFVDFWTSDNTIVKQTVNNFVKYNLRRALVNATFFVPYIPGVKKYFEKWKRTGEAGVDIGMAANSAYLLSDVLNRRMTPFEELQSLIDRKINHAEHYADAITSTDLLDIYERHAESDPNKSFMPLRGTPKWNEVAALFDRMADLMNQTYHNVVPSENVEFGFSRFVYLIGHQMIDPDLVERSRVYVEIAAQYGIKALKESHRKLEAGVLLDEIIKDYPKAAITKAETPPPALTPESEPSLVASKIIDKKQPQTTFAAQEQHRKEQQMPGATLAV